MKERSSWDQEPMLTALTHRDGGKAFSQRKESYEEHTTLGGSPFHQGMQPAEWTSRGERQEIKFLDLVLIPSSSFLLELPISQVPPASLGHIAY